MEQTSSAPRSYIELLATLVEEATGISSSPNFGRAFSYSVELANLHYDFERMGELLSKFWDLLDVAAGDESGSGLALRRFAVAYTEDNAVIRVHAYRERAFQLADHLLDLGIPETSLKLNEEVQSGLRKKGYRGVLDQLERFAPKKSADGTETAIRKALERRKEFTHRLPVRDWDLLKAGRQLLDWVNLDRETDTIGERTAIDIALDCEELKPKMQSILDFVSSLSAELDVFEKGFCSELYSAVVSRYRS